MLALTSLALATLHGQFQGQLPVIPGKFAPTAELLKQYETPAWFRDAKFGIWAHWGPQSVPMMGDWYARNMFMQGSAQYEDHLRRYGHPSVHGYREIIDQWKAENWDPARLMRLYKEAGARYFVSMACHHDNFDLWDSKFHSFNAVKMGPHKDVVGIWQREAKRNGMRFGVSEHMGASFTWFQVSRGSDKTGPYTGVPYEGANPSYSELYHQAAEPGDRGWYSVNRDWMKEWFNRVSDLVTNYKPDLLYSDGGLPFEEVGRTLVSNFYNQSIANHDGKLEAVYNCKQIGSGSFDAASFVQDMERGIMPRINPRPWQTDTSIGDWFYNRNWKFRDPDWVIHSLVDIVSKNGNLLLNVVQRPDGTIDPEVETLLHTVGAWMKVNGESIYGTRPWVTFGEGPTKSGGGNFREDFGFSAKDVRYVQKGSHTIYATTLGVPSSPDLTLASLASGPESGKVRAVSMLGGPRPKWTQDAAGLHITLGDLTAIKLSLVLKIDCDNNAKFKPSVTVKQAQPALRPDSNGTFMLSAATAGMDGSGPQLETKDGIENLGFWDNAEDSATWRISVPTAGRYKVIVDAATTNEGALLQVSVGTQKVVGTIPNTGDWAKFTSTEFGALRLPAGTLEVKVGAANGKPWHAINLRKIRFEPN